MALAELGQRVRYFSDALVMGSEGFVEGDSRGFAGSWV